jgi:hypothetical protein
MSGSQSQRLPVKTPLIACGTWESPSDPHPPDLCQIIMGWYIRVLLHRPSPVWTGAGVHGVCPAARYLVCRQISPVDRIRLLLLRRPARHTPPNAVIIPTLGLPADHAGVILRQGLRVAILAIVATLLLRNSRNSENSSPLVAMLRISLLGSIARLFLSLRRGTPRYGRGSVAILAILATLFLRNSRNSESSRGLPLKCCVVINVELEVRTHCRTRHTSRRWAPPTSSPPSTRMNQPCSSRMLAMRCAVCLSRIPLGPYWYIRMG